MSPLSLLHCVSQSFPLCFPLILYLHLQLLLFLICSEGQFSPCPSLWTSLSSSPSLCVSTGRSSPLPLSLSLVSIPGTCTPTWPALDPTCNGVDSRHHQQDHCGEVKVPAQGHLDEEGSREDVSLQRPDQGVTWCGHQGVSPPCSTVPAAVSPRHMTRTSLKCCAEEDGLDLAEPP